MKNSASRQDFSAQHRAFDGSEPSHVEKRTSDRMEIVKRALDLGLEIVFHNGKARLFKAGQIAAMTGGYFAVEEPTLMRSVLRSDGTAGAYRDDAGNWDWLIQCVNDLSHESVSKIAAACSAHSTHGRSLMKTATITTNSIRSTDNVVAIQQILRPR